MPAGRPADGEEILPGRIYVAPPDEHMILEPGRVRLLHGPKENRTRPAIDPLFRSAAIAYGPRVVGIVLTGLLDDGTAGLLAIKDCGGVAIVQDPAEAFAPSMPRSALSQVEIDHCRPVAEIAPLLVRYDPPPPTAAPLPALMQVEQKLAVTGLSREVELAEFGTATELTCPECHGTLYEARDKRVLRFRCRSGHALSALTLLSALAAEREKSLWSAARAMTEEAVLTRRLWQRPKSSVALRDRAARLERGAGQLHDLLRAIPERIGGSVDGRYEP